MGLEQKLFLKALGLVGFIGFLIGDFAYMNSQYRLFPPMMPSQGGYDGYVFTFSSPWYIFYMIVNVISLIFHIPAICLINPWLDAPVYVGISFDVIIWTLLLYLMWSKKENSIDRLDDL